jgi:hypothetical protein
MAEKRHFLHAIGTRLAQSRGTPQTHPLTIVPAASAPAGPIDKPHAELAADRLCTVLLPVAVFCAVQYIILTAAKGLFMANHGEGQGATCPFQGNRRPNSPSAALYGV